MKNPQLRETTDGFSPLAEHIPELWQLGGIQEADRSRPAQFFYALQLKYADTEFYHLVLVGNQKQWQ